MWPENSAPPTPIMPTSMAPTHRYSDMLEDPTYSPKSAPKKGEGEWDLFSRRDFETGAHVIRFLSHPTLLPAGFHKYTTHKIPTATGDPIKCLCTETWDPGAPCYMCSLIKDLDDAKNNKNDSILNEATLTPRLFKVVVENATMYCRSIFLPFLCKGRVALVPNTKDPSKSYKRIYPDANALFGGILSLAPGRPNDYGGFPDKSFDEKLTYLTLTDEAIQRHFQILSLRDPAKAQAFYSEVAQLPRNPNLFDAQHGSWINFNKPAKASISLIAMPPSSLSPELIAKYLNEKTYPNMLSWGDGKGQSKGKQLSWYEVAAAFQHSWAGQELQNLHGWDLNLDPNEWDQRPRHSSPQPQAPAPQQQNWGPTADGQTWTDDIPF